MASLLCHYKNGPFVHHHHKWIWPAHTHVYTLSLSSCFCRLSFDSPKWAISQMPGYHKKGGFRNPSWKQTSSGNSASICGKTVNRKQEIPWSSCTSLPPDLEIYDALECKKERLLANLKSFWCSGRLYSSFNAGGVSIHRCTKFMVIFEKYIRSNRVEQKTSCNRYIQYREKQSLLWISFFRERPLRVTWTQKRTGDTATNAKNGQMAIWQLNSNLRVGILLNCLLAMVYM